MVAGTEWHFYLVVPAIVWGGRRRGILGTTAILGALCMAVRFWVFAAPGREVYWAIQMPPRLIEFLWGVMVSDFIARGVKPPRLFRGALGFWVGCAVTFGWRKSNKGSKWTA